MAISGLKWPRGLRRGSAGTAGSNSAGGHGYLSIVCVLSGTGLGGGPITRPEESYRMRRV